MSQLTDHLRRKEAWRPTYFSYYQVCFFAFFKRTQLWLPMIESGLENRGCLNVLNDTKG